jgi:Kef-type K+ transport system membrane component KefB
MNDQRKSLIKTSLLYTLLTVICAGLFLFINSHGKTLYSSSMALPRVSTNKDEWLFHFLLALIVIIIVTRIGGTLSKLLKQPPVIGEIIGGIVLGPSLLGQISPETMLFFFPKTIMPLLNAVAQLGIILYMFLVGLEIDLNALKKSAHSTIAISHGSIVFPFILGSSLALWCFDFLAPQNIDFTSFALFLGISMSITAFPVLARILTDQGLHKTKLGGLALTCAAIDDITAWCLLAFLTSFIEAKISNAVSTLICTISYILLMLLVIKPILAKKLPELKENGLFLLLAGAILSACLTELIGIHALFGAFLFGAIIPHNNSLSVDINFRLQDIVKIIFLPAFFAFTGMRTQINLLNSPRDWFICAVIIAVATIGKFGGTLIAARFTGHSWKNSTVLGILMNTRGLVELIVLNIGLDLGVISHRLFTMMVIMALFTTIITGPVLRLIKGFEEN